MNARWGLWSRISWNPPDFTLKSSGFHPWNLADFTQISPVKSTQIIKASVSAKTLQIWHVKSTQNYKSKCFSKNSSVWWMQGGGFHPRNLVDFTLKSGGFQPWNLVDFTQISPVKSTQNYKSKCFSKNSSVWRMQGGGYDQVFHEIHQISPWNLVDFTCEIQQSSPRFHLWNPPKIIKASVSAKTLQFDECKVGAMTKYFMKSTWNPLDFKIMSFCMMIKYRSFIFQKTNQKSFCWNIWFYKVWGGFHLKSTRFHEICWISPEIRRISCGFHVKSKDLLQGIVTLCLFSCSTAFCNT